MPSLARLSLAVAVAARLAAAQSYERGARAIDDCRARLPAGAVFNVLNGTAGATGTRNLNAGAPGLFVSTSTCTGNNLNSLPKNVSGAALHGALPHAALHGALIQGSWNYHAL